MNKVPLKQKKKTKISLKSLKWQKKHPQNLEIGQYRLETTKMTNNCPIMTKEH